MSAFVKSKLKSARDAITKKEFAAARDAATQVLDYEPANYNACVLVFVVLGYINSCFICAKIRVSRFSTP